MAAAPGSLGDETCALAASRRLRSPPGGQGDFLAELRPAVAVFVRFIGIDFHDDPEALAQLDGFVRRVQTILGRYEGTLIQLTIGDKGSYLYSAFGAPIAHEDDISRAVSAAAEISALADEECPRSRSASPQVASARAPTAATSGAPTECSATPSTSRRD